MYVNRCLFNALQATAVFLNRMPRSADLTGAGLATELGDQFEQLADEIYHLEASETNASPASPKPLFDRSPIDEIAKATFPVEPGMKGKVKEQWGKLTDDDITVIEGKLDQLVGRVQERYGIAKEKAEEQVKAWEGSL